MSAQTVSELQAVLSDIRRVLESVEWGASLPERKPAVVIGLSIGKVAIAQRLASSIDSHLARIERESVERARITDTCIHCSDTHVVSVLIGAEERLLPCRVCSSFSHSGAAA